MWYRGSGGLAGLAGLWMLGVVRQAVAMAMVSLYVSWSLSSASVESESAASPLPPPSPPPPPPGRPALWTLWVKGRKKIYITNCGGESKADFYAFSLIFANTYTQAHKFAWLSFSLTHSLWVINLSGLLLSPRVYEERTRNGAVKKIKIKKNEKKGKGKKTGNIKNIKKKKPFDFCICG